jgi:hypothetical protein
MAAMMTGSGVRCDGPGNGGVVGHSYFILLMVVVLVQVLVSTLGFA